MIFGLGAALGWGAADLLAAISGRRIGAAATAILAQVSSAVTVSIVFVVAGADTEGLASVAGWLLPNAVVTVFAYLTLYRALELGPIAVVSPLLASYAVFPVLLAVAFLGETLSTVQTAGVVVTIGGAILTSTDVRALRARRHSTPPALLWALVSTVLFGVSSYAIGWASQEAGWLPSLWLARTSAAALFAVGAAGVLARCGRSGFPDVGRRAVLVVLALGLVDLTGTMSYARGAEVGLLSIVTAVSATYPLIPVFGGIAVFGERPAPSQYAGVAMVVGGLMLLA